MFALRLINHRPRHTALFAWFGMLGVCPLLACSGSEASEAETPSFAAPGGTPSSGDANYGAPAGNGVPDTSATADDAAPAAPADDVAEGEPNPPVPSAAQGPAEPEGQEDGAPLEPPPPADGAETGGEGSAGPGGEEGVPLDPQLLSRCTGISPITCRLDAPNGNYDVSVEVGDPNSDAVSRISAETRHYAGPAVATAAGTYSVATFTVNVRAEVHDGGQSAPGNVLDLLIDGPAPKLRKLGIRPAPSSLTVFIASDSTACDWVSTNTSALASDETGWGQALSMYFKRGVAIANYADSGETSGSFYGKFFPAARAAMKAGDYLFIQFGHNNKQPADIARYEGDLLRYIADARDRDVTPVIFTPVSRSSGTAANPGFNGLDQVARDVAAREGVALIDLTALSRAFYATAPNRSALFIDGTHFHETGAIEVAGVVATALKQSGLGLADFLR